MSDYNSVNNARSSTWFRNAIRYRCERLFPHKRDSHLWVFSAWEGKKYTDNAKYLYEYVLKHHPEIRCVWQTSSAAVFEQLQGEGKPVELTGTSASRKTQKKAGVAVFTNGLDDFGNKPYVYSAKIVSLWHGIGPKKAYRALLPSNRSWWVKALSRMRWRFFNWVKRDITAVCSEYGKKVLGCVFDLPPAHKFVLTGQPRNDIFAEPVDMQKVFNKELLQRLQGKRMVLYMPTFRKNTAVMHAQLKALFSSHRLDDILEKNNAYLIVKLHYLNRCDFPATKNSCLMNDADAADTQQLLACADMVITDYSSAAIDFALTERPVLFFFPDWDGYRADDMMMPENKTICNVNCAFSQDDFLKKLEQTLQDPAIGVAQSKKLNGYYDGTGVKPGQYSEKAFNEIARILNIQ